MTPINDKHGTTVGYLHDNIILDADTQNVVGLVLGNCVFGDSEVPIGKYLNNTFRTISGKVIGVTGDAKKAVVNINKLKILEGAWKILNRVKDHVCSWIQEVEEWADGTFSEFLRAKNNGNQGYFNSAGSLM